jgi:arabinan endo-1,5-alpha-L-arabinosidase
MGGTGIAIGDGKIGQVEHNSAYNIDGNEYLISHGYSIPDGISKFIVTELKWHSEGWPIVELK